MVGNSTSAARALEGGQAGTDWSTTPLDPGRLLTSAEESVGLRDWGDDPTFRDGLEKLVAAVENMGAAKALRPHVAKRALHYLVTRLRLVDDERKHPEVLKGRIERPLIVTGLPRTGTTWLYELLALDPVVRAPLDWEVQRPWPAPEAATYDTDPRIAEMEEVNRAIVAGAPELATMHNWHARLPQECNAFTAYHFVASNFWAWWAVPDYTSWITHDRPKGVFNTHKRVLQQLQWKGPKGRWTLKAPPHIFMLDELIEAYPDACLIQTHREPARVLASNSNMVRSRRKEHFADQPDLMDPKTIARSALDHWGIGLERATESRRKPEIDARFIDVAYRDVVREPLAVVRRIYEHFDLPYTQEFEERVKSRIAAPTASGHGKHHYDPGEFDIPGLDLPNQFKQYRSRFGGLLSE